MGLSNYLARGATLRREALRFNVDPSKIGSINLGSAYALLSVETDIPCRLRLYDTAASRNDATETSRPFIVPYVRDNIALVGDFTMSAAGKYTIDPVTYGVVDDAASSLTYYRVDGTFSGATPTITLNRFVMENSAISIDSRKTVQYITGSLNAGALVSGKIENSSTPNVYLLVSASITNPSAFARLRLYSTSGSLTDASEVSRSFATESVAKDLIADIIITGSQTTYFSPKIIGANLETVGYVSSSLSQIQQNRVLVAGYRSFFYILQNAGTSGPTTISASLHVFSLED
jgi:hypothetical protein